MKRIFKLVSLFLLLSASTISAVYADDDTSTNKFGTVRGRIVDTDKQTLPGASIYIEKLRTGVVSDVNGFYTIPNLEPGTHIIKVTYVGYAPTEITITLPSGNTLDKDLILHAGDE